MQFSEFIHPPYQLTLTRRGDAIDVAISVAVTGGTGGHAITLSRDEARTLHTDLGEMLGTFELSDV